MVVAKRFKAGELFPPNVGGRYITGGTSETSAKKWCEEWAKEYAGHSKKEFLRACYDRKAERKLDYDGWLVVWEDEIVENEFGLVSP